MLILSCRECVLFVCMCARDCVVLQEIPWIVSILFERRIPIIIHAGLEGFSMDATTCVDQVDLK